jgi:hypothetical protein
MVGPQHDQHQREQLSDTKAHACYSFLHNSCTFKSSLRTDICKKCRIVHPCLCTATWQITDYAVLLAAKVLSNLAFWLSWIHNCGADVHSRVCLQSKHMYISTATNAVTEKNYHLPNPRASCIPFCILRTKPRLPNITPAAPHQAYAHNSTTPVLTDSLYNSTAAYYAPAGSCCKLLQLLQCSNTPAASRSRRSARCWCSPSSL